MAQINRFNIYRNAPRNPMKLYIHTISTKIHLITSKGLNNNNGTPFTYFEWHVGQNSE
uniref:Uncharacterized protein n=1 Tax=Arundo donax TaxID=35708 RepID=A0A0A9HMT7_ARUDO